MINLIRIDDRLIHGQVMAVWVRILSITHIIIYDDEVAQDAFTRQIMQLAVPAPMKLSIVDNRQVSSLVATAASDPSRTLVLLRSTRSALQLYSHWPYSELNVGGIGMAPGRNLIWKSIAASPEEMAHLRNLQSWGVTVYMQMVPSDEKHHLPDG